jgi:hypothetical protein
MQMDFPKLKNCHERLYKAAIKTYIPQYAKKGYIDQSAIDEIESFLEEIEVQSSQVSTIDNFQWLANIASKWQVILSALNIPRAVALELPERQLKPSAAAMSYLSEGEIEAQIREKAYLFSRERISHRAEILFDYIKIREKALELASNPSKIFSLVGYTSDEIDERNDWHNAAASFAFDVFVGKVNFWRQIGPESYWRLELQWLDNIKQLLAFTLWRKRGGGWGEAEKHADFLAACADVAYLLVNVQNKVPPSYFFDIRDYLEEKYLSNGKVDFSKPDTKSLVKHKSEQLYNVHWSNNSDENWFYAESYVSFFYGSIIPAVIGDEEHLKRKLYNVLVCSDEAIDATHIINCFEIMLFKQFVWLNGPASPALGAERSHH